MNRFILTSAFVYLALGLFAQEIKIVVSDRDEPASYAFIKVNDKYVGMADSLGVFMLSKGLVQKGDTLSAEYITLLSDKVLYVPRSDEYNLEIQELVLDNVHIESEKLYTFEEYEEILKTKENYYNWSLNYYELEYGQSIRNNLTDSIWSSSGTMDLAVHYSMEPPYRILKHTFVGDTSRMEKHIAAVLLGTRNNMRNMLTNWAKVWRKNGKLIIHKIRGAESETSSYGFIGGLQSDDRMIVYVDNTTKRITEVRFLSLIDGALLNFKIMVDYNPDEKSSYPKEIIAEMNRNNGLHVNTHIKINEAGRMGKKKLKQIKNNRGI